ncbi:MtrAB system accessory protein LpqB [Skermania sp. ID1734]|uniref:MtrAB system accessory lipoprotein LpqB n=1 Tax=Skermania sp. ID1734 TaxID=2597516 RepID=UPI0011808942|nr:MtrAB system accessory lipoprotein LpqB [Skermania sp. ID1734]TSD97342.1 MtrAB system accessory protein LpqB [Skermania sp. ID1734]
MTRRLRGSTSWIGAVLAAIVLTVTGCASLPDTSTPEAIGTIAREPVSPTVPKPTPGREPDLLLRDFFKASTDPSDHHAAARQFLTPDASKAWDDAASATIVDKVDVLPDSRTSDQATYVVRANRVGQLAPGGDYQAEEGNFETKISLRRVNGEWRVDQVPPGVIMDRPQFLNTYQRKSLYFLDPTGTTTVADPRWISASQDQLAAQLIDMLMRGPKDRIKMAVRTQFSPGITLAGPITKADGRTSSVGVGLGGIRIDFNGVDGMDKHNRELLAAQVIWTLASAEISGPYVLEADGKPLNENLANGWTTADVNTLNPIANAGTNVPLHAVRDGGLVKVDAGAVTPVPGYFGAVHNLQSAALSRDGSFIAAVADTGRKPPDAARALMMGSADGSAFPVADGNTITRPTWAADDGSAWAVIDGTNVISAVRDRQTGQVSLTTVNADAINALGGPITELRLSRDGVRVALIVGGKVYVAIVVTGSDGKVSLVNPRPVAIGLGSPAQSLDWITGETLVVARSASDIPVVMITVDGSRMDSLPSRNLTPPVTSVEASSTTEFVADSRAVFQLNNNDPAADRLWREVPGLAGVQAIPVLPG